MRIKMIEMRTNKLKDDKGGRSKRAEGAGFKIIADF
jgi:hypothetical protein